MGSLDQMEVPAVALTATTVPEPIIYINGKRRVLPDGYAEATLLEYLREIGLRGTKLGCGEGGCGACTVMVSHYDFAEKKIVHRSVNACLAPLYSVEGMHVVTVEGIGNRRDGLHPVQERLSKAHGSQCGFCTPGFVMSMYSLLRSSPGPPTEEEIEENLAGNLCRCTGYRPILDAFRVFAKTDAAAYTQDALKANGASTNGVATPGTGASICPSTGKPCDCGKEAAEKLGYVGAPLVPAVAPGLVPTTSPAEPIFPPELMSRKFGSLLLGGGGGATWYRPTSLGELLELKGKFPGAKVVVGNSEVGIELKFKHAGYQHLIGTTAVPELNVIAESEQGMVIGGAVTLTNMMKAMKAAMADRKPHETMGCAAIVEQLRWFAGNQIRNVASVGGNICTASPISDLNPLWVAAGAIFTLDAAGATKSRQVAARDFFLGYRKVDMLPEEVLTSVFLPWTRPLEYVKEYKQAHRRDDDIALVNAGMRVHFEERRKKEEEGGGSSWVVAEAGLSFGGVAAKTVTAGATEAYLVGKEWTQETLHGALEVLRKEIVVPDNAPGGMPEFRRSLVSSFFFKFFLHASLSLHRSTHARSPHHFPDTHASAVAPYHKPPAVGLQYYDPGAAGPAAAALGSNSRHLSADPQVTGEAQYIDDVEMPSDGLHGALVLSTRAHAKILAVDASGAEKCPGFVGYFSHGDVPGHNDFGAVAHDEEVFASREVTCVGQIIGVVVVSGSHEAAKLAARKVVVTYEDLPAIFDIEDAVAQNSFHSLPFSGGAVERKMEAGDVEAAFREAEEEEGKEGARWRVVSGTVRMGGQEQFYLEPNVSLVWTVDNGDEVHMLSSTQAPTHHQNDVARVLGLPLHKVVCRTKRIGGGFGGKETRSVIVAAAAAVPAWHLKRPVKIVLDRDVDMAITGQRHPFLGKYKVAFSPEGRVHALDLCLYNNGGNSLDLSHAILERAMFHSENVYRVPHMRVRARIAKTHLPSNTAFRGFGGPQGMLVCEQWMEHVARSVGRPVEDVRELNFHGEGHEVHYGQTIERVQTQRIWSELKATGEYEKRRAEVDAFNRKNRWLKRGLALVPTKFGISFTTKFLNQGGSLVHIYTDGTVLVTHGGVEMGQGLHTKVAQVAAHALGCPLSDVFISETATDKVPNTSPTAASASSDLYGMATLRACEELVERMKGVKEGMPPGATFKELASKCYFERINLSAQGFYATPSIGFDWSTGKGHPFAYHTYGAALAEAEVDTLTGAFSLPRVDLVMDVGKSINPAIDIGQVEGGFIQGLGWTVTEELKWGDKSHPWIRPGNLFTQGPGTYKIPSANDIPTDFRVTLLREAPNPKAVLSSKAVGEPPLFLAASAFFAIKDAVFSARKDAGIDGYFVLDSPATPERVRMACTDEFTLPFATPDIRPKLSV